MSSKKIAALIGTALVASECSFAETNPAPAGADNRPPPVGDGLPESFMKKWRAAENDLEILLVGDSLTGNTGGSGDNPAASQSPPGFNHLHWGYLLWDGICANKPVCDRFDSERDGAPVFKKTGDWSFQSAGKFNIPSISGEHSRATDGTWMSDSPDAKIEFIFDAAACDKLNIVGGQHPDGADCLVKISEGDGKLLASIDKTTWVEANNFGFSQQQKSEQSVTVTGIALHQRHRRLWMKSADKAGAGILHVSFEKASIDDNAGRFIYFWGTERWRGTSVFVTNIGRGGRNIDLLNRNITDIYDRNPDLVILGMPLNNDCKIAYPQIEDAYRAYFFGNPGKPDSYKNTRSLLFNSKNYEKFACLAFLPTGRARSWNGDTPIDYKDDSDMLPDLKFKKIYDFIASNNTYPNLKLFNLHDRMIDEAKERGMTIQESLSPGNFTTDGVHLSGLGSRLYAKHLLALFTLP